jgi:circadian clock protein KaiC
MMDDNQTRLSTGIAGLDDILYGGLARGFLYLVEGNPGAGKTTLALQFLIEGARRGEKGLYISLAESESELRHVAKSEVTHVYSFGPIWTPGGSVSPRRRM